MCVGLKLVWKKSRIQCRNIQIQRSSYHKKNIPSFLFWLHNLISPDGCFLKNGGIHFNRVSIINHPFWGTTILGNPIYLLCLKRKNPSICPDATPFLWVEILEVARPHEVMVEKTSAIGLSDISNNDLQLETVKNISKMLKSAWKCMNEHAV